MKTNYILTIKAEDRPGLLHHLTGIINKKQVQILSLNAAQTDIHEIVLVTIEISTSELIVTSLALRLENVIEVYRIDVKKAGQTVTVRAAYFKMSRQFLQSRQLISLQKHEATIVNFSEKSVLLANYGSDFSIRNLNAELEGPNLLGFSQSGLIGDTELIENDDVRVIWLAA